MRLAIPLKWQIFDNPMRRNVTIVDVISNLIGKKPKQNIWQILTKRLHFLWKCIEYQNQKEKKKT